MASQGELDQRLDRIARHPFRARFHLRERERSYAELRSEQTLRVHADELIAKRLAPAAPYKDGKQTPYRGHPVFVAQHATATCCRTCLERRHGIERGRELSADERAYVVDVITCWIERELEQPPDRRGPPAGASQRPRPASRSPSGAGTGRPRRDPPAGRRAGSGTPP
jgi:hypothetical protein